MRSRLEASFAQWLDDQSAEWLYEEQCYASKDGQYLPDFDVYFGWRDEREFCEVKPENADFAEALQRMHVILASEPLARLTVKTRRPLNSYPVAFRPKRPDLNPAFITVAICTPDDPCGCEREKLPRGYDRP